MKSCRVSLKKHVHFVGKQCVPDTYFAHGDSGHYTRS